MPLNKETKSSQTKQIVLENKNKNSESSYVIMIESR